MATQFQNKEKYNRPDVLDADAGRKEGICDIHRLSKGIRQNKNIKDCGGSWKTRCKTYPKN